MQFLKFSLLAFTNFNTCTMLQFCQLLLVLLFCNFSFIILQFIIFFYLKNNNFNKKDFPYLSNLVSKTQNSFCILIQMKHGAIRQTPKVVSYEYLCSA